MSAPKKSAIALFFVVLVFALGFATAATIPGDTPNLYKVTITSPKPNDKVDQTFDVTYTSRKPADGETAYLRVYLSNADGYFATLQRDQPVDGKDHSFSVNLDVVPATATYSLEFTEVYIPAPGANAQYFDAKIPIAAK